MNVKPRRQTLTGGAREVRIDDLVGVRVEVNEHLKDELACRLCILLRTCIDVGGHEHHFTSYQTKQHENIITPSKTVVPEEATKNGGQTIKLWKEVDDMRVDDLLLQKVLLVQKEYHRRVLKPRICDDRSEQRLRLFHPVLKGDT